jgi:hypothetical protein
LKEREDEGVMKKRMEEMRKSWKEERREDDEGREGKKRTWRN